MRVVIIGMGKAGIALARSHLHKHHRVEMVDHRYEVCERASNELGRKVIHGDGSTIEVLEKVETGKADVFIAVTGSDENNLVACQLAKLHFGVKKVSTRINNPKNHEIVKKIGAGVIDSIVNSTDSIVKAIESGLIGQGELNFITMFQQEKLSINEATIGERSQYINKKILELELPQNCILVSILREGHMIIPRGGVTLHKGDKVVAACPPKYRKEVEAALDHISGETGEAGAL